MTDLSLPMQGIAFEQGKNQKAGLVPQCHLIDQTLRIRKSQAKMPASSPPIREVLRLSPHM